MIDRTQPVERNLVLDGLRGVAALMILGFHVGAFTGSQYVEHGYLAVDLFFVLSGAVIARAYDERLRAGMSAGRFLAIRLARLYPMYAVGAALGIARIVALMHDVGEPMTMRVAAAAALNAVMLPAPLGNPALYPFNIPAWSLFFELVANLLYAQRLFRLSTRVLAVIAAVGAVLMTVGAIGFSTLDLGVQWGSSSYGLARVLFAFPAGMVIARMTPPVRASATGSLVALALLAMALAVPKSLMPAPLFDLAFALAFAPLLIWTCAGFAAPKSIQRPFRLVGDLSYPLYAIHFPLAALIIEGSVRMDAPREPVMVAAFAVPILVAAVLAHWYDRPVRRWLAARVALPSAVA